MSGKLKALLISGFSILVLGCLAFALLVPRHNFATRAEMEKVIDPRLLVRFSEDLEAQARYRRIRALAEKYSAEEPIGLSGFGVGSKGRAVLEEVRKIVTEGPIQEPLDGSPASNMMGAASEFALLSLFIGTHSEELEGVMPIDEALLCARRLQDGARTSAAVTNMSWFESNVFNRIQSKLLRSSPTVQEMQTWIKAIPEDDCKQQDPIKLAAAEMQAALRWLGDPFKHRKPIPTKMYTYYGGGNEEELKSWFEAYEKGLWTGQFDSVKSAKLLSDILISQIDKKPLPQEVSDAQASLYTSYSRMMGSTSVSSTVPPPPVPDFELIPSYVNEKGLARIKGQLVFSWKRNRYHNSVGLALLSMGSAYTSYGYTRPTMAPARDLTKTAVAMHIYRKKHGRFPRDVKALVEEGILEKMPIDCLSGKPIQYDSKKKMVWSPGRNKASKSPKQASLWYSDQPAMIIWQ